MSVLSIIPVTDIHEVDVRDTLNANGGNASDDWASLCGADGNANVWSKKKPVRLSAIACQDHTVGADNYYAQWWRAYNQLCGFNLDNARVSGWEALRGKFDGDMNGWVYERPIGGEASPYRITDFGGYYPAARPITHGFVAPSVVYRDDTTATAMMAMAIENEYSLTWGDFPSLSSYYFGVLLYRSANDYRRVTAGRTLADNGAEVVFNPSRLTTGATYTVYPFICSHAIGEDDVDPSGLIIYPCPVIQPTSLQVVSTDIIIYATAQKNNAARSVSCEVYVTSGSTRTFTNNYVRVYKRGEIDAAGYVETTLPNVTATSGVRTFVGSGVAYPNYSNFEFTNMNIRVTMNSGAYEYDTMVANDISVDTPK